jgi:DNA-binding transcriptional ArsR family regulator
MVNYSAAPNAALDHVFGALSDHTRRAILARLAQGEATVGELAEPFDVSLPAVSKHLRVLESAGLLRRKIDGRIHRCRLSPQPMKEAARWIEHYRAFWEDQFDALAKFLESTNTEEKHSWPRRKANPVSPCKSDEPSRRRAKKSSTPGRNAKS